MANKVITETDRKMDKTITAFERDLAHVRTGRASTALLEGITVDYYGTQMPLNQVASIAVPESRLLTVQPWDNNVLEDIEKAIMSSNMGLTPTSDGKIIRVNIPALTEERRKELVKIVKKMAEDSRVAVRNSRRDAIDQLKDQKRNKEISEDEMYKLQDDIQKLTDKHIKQIDEILQKKDKEIMEF